MDACQLLVGVVLGKSSGREKMRESVLAAFSDLSAQPHFCGWNCQLAEHPDLESLAKALDAHFRDQPQPRAIVVSDQLVEPGANLPQEAAQEQLSHKAKELLDPDFLRPLGMLAVTVRGGRVTDVDRAVRFEATREEVAQSLLRVAQRLEYVTRPARHLNHRPTFAVRRVANEFELMKYFRMRHEVYTVMGYLSEEKEHVPSRLEIDGCDEFAIHLGAFDRGQGYEELAGTARVLLAQRTPNCYSAWTRRLLTDDARLRSLVANENLSLCLPIFHSQDLNHHLFDAYLEGLLLAELSRVIVSPAYRGAGLSNLIIANAIAEARGAGVDRLYLECLRLHEPLYARFGFQVIPNTQGTVIGVRRSMIAMQLELNTPAPSPTPRATDHVAH